MQVSKFLLIGFVLTLYTACDASKKDKSTTIEETIEVENIDPLPSWNQGTTKAAIMEFVDAGTDKNNKDYVAPEKRVATFDNDGALWLE